MSIEELAVSTDTHILIANSLRLSGYEIADTLGIRVQEPRPNVIGILKERSAIPRNFLGYRWEKKQRAIHIARLWLNNQTREVTTNKNGFLEVYGKSYMKELADIAKIISETYRFPIAVELKDENPKLERYESDHGGRNPIPYASLIMSLFTKPSKPQTF